MPAPVFAPDRDDSPQEDHIVVLRGGTWGDYQRLLEIRGDHSAPRISFLAGDVEIMTPSQNHESLKSLIGRLVEVYCLEAGIEFRTLGSWTLEEKALERGVEPDECYIFGGREANRPDLAIEVVWTRGGIKKLEIYRGLGVREVWFWRRGAITPYVLRDGEYAEVATSEALPELDLAALCRFLDRPTTSAAIREFRDHLRAAGH